MRHITWVLSGLLLSLEVAAQAPAAFPPSAAASAPEVGDASKATYKAQSPGPGREQPELRPLPTAVAIQGWETLGDISSVATGACTTFSWEGGTAYCFGRQLGAAPDGHLGAGPGSWVLANVSAPAPVAPTNPPVWSQLSSGAYTNPATQVTDAFNCGVQADSSAWCWGSDFSGLGLLGSGQPESSAAPVRVAADGPFSSVAAGAGFACALKTTTGSISCWGSNSFGQLGCGQLPGQLPNTATPCQVAATQRWLEVAAGQSAACAVNSTGALYCWGALASGNSAGQPALFAEPQLVAGATDVLDVAVGSLQACFVGRNRWAWCFRLGEWPARLVPVPGQHRYNAISVGADHQCGVTVDGRVLCWGSNLFGQCGDGGRNAALDQPTPVQVQDPASLSFEAVQAGNRFTCIWSGDGKVFCFGGATQQAGGNPGYTFGELGDGTFRSSPVPRQVQPPLTPPLPTPSPGPSPVPVPSPASPPLPPSPRPVPLGTSGAPVGAIVGGVLGGVAVLAAGAAATWYVRRRRSSAPDPDPETPVAGPAKPGSFSDVKTLSVDDSWPSNEQDAAQRGQHLIASASSGAVAAVGTLGSAPGSDVGYTDELLSWITSHPPSTPQFGPTAGTGLPFRAGSSTINGSFTSGKGSTALGEPDAAQEAGELQQPPEVAAAQQRGPDGQQQGGGAAAQPADGGSQQPEREEQQQQGGAAALVPAARAGRPGAGRSQLIDVQPFVIPFSALRMERVIGQGSYGKVYLATLNMTPVACKILMKLEAGGPSGEVHPVTPATPLLSKLYKEAEVLAVLRHPHVVSLLAVCAYPPAIVTEFCERGSLAGILADARRDPAYAALLSWRLRLNMAVDAATGMLALHAHDPPILHRDCKSPNLLCDFSWRVKVADFNLAKILEHDAAMSSTQSPANPRWLAPEILQGAKATAASDVFSFGVVLHELLTWELPWTGVDFWEIVSRLMAGERLPIPPRDRLPGPDTARFAALPDYCALIHACCAHDPAARPCFRGVIQELRRLLDLAP